MKLNEPRDNEKDRWPKGGGKRAGRKPANFRPTYVTKGGILLTAEDHKSYTDYLKQSSYKKSYKDFCIKYYMEHIKDEVINDILD